MAESPFFVVDVDQRCPFPASGDESAGQNAASQENTTPASPASGPRPGCSRCGTAGCCLPFGMDEGDLGALDGLDGLVGAHRKLKRRQTLYRTGDTFQAIYAIRSGAFKTGVWLEDGREQVTGFQMSGEILGLDGISAGRHACSAVALQDSEVCVIAYARLEELSRRVKGLQHQFHKAMSREIVRDHGIMMLLGSMRAEERLATFLLGLSQRHAARGFPADEFHLQMSREEIGSYLGLTIETISRAFSRLQDETLIAVRQKHVRILDSSGLDSLARRHPGER